MQLMNHSDISFAAVIAIIAAADLTLLVLEIPRTWALGATLLVTLGGILGLAWRAGQRARRLQGSTSPRRMA
jgi:hypothetical protein